MLIVSFFNQGEPRQVELNLVKLTAGWRIDDIHWREGTLRSRGRASKRRSSQCQGPRVGTNEGVRPIVGYLLALAVGLIFVAAVPWISIGFLKR